MYIALKELGVPVVLHNVDAIKNNNNNYTVHISVHKDTNNLGEHFGMIKLNLFYPSWPQKFQRPWS